MSCFVFSQLRKTAEWTNAVVPYAGGALLALRLGFPLPPVAQVHRQSEQEFIGTLHAIRDGSATREQLDRLWQLCRWAHLSLILCCQHAPVLARVPSCKPGLPEPQHNQHLSDLHVPIHFPPLLAARSRPLPQDDGINPTTLYCKNINADQ